MFSGLYGSVKTHIGRRVTTLIPSSMMLRLIWRAWLTSTPFSRNAANISSHSVEGWRPLRMTFTICPGLGLNVCRTPDKIVRNILVVSCNHFSDFQAVGRVLNRYLPASLGLDSIHNCSVYSSKLCNYRWQFLSPWVLDELTFPETPLVPATAVWPARVSYRFVVEIFGFSAMSTFPTLAVLLGWVPFPLRIRGVPSIKIVIICWPRPFFPLGPHFWSRQGFCNCGLVTCYQPGDVLTGDVTEGKLVKEEGLLNTPDSGFLPHTRFIRDWSGAYIYTGCWLEPWTGVGLECGTFFFLFGVILHKNYNTRTTEITTRHTTQEKQRKNAFMKRSLDSFTITSTI